MKRYLFLVLLAAVYVSAVMGFYEQGEANILVAWDATSAAVTEQSPTFDMLNKIRLGNPLWFID